MEYQPPFTVTANSIRLIAEISENIGRLTAQLEQAKALRLRRINRIRTIQGSLADSQPNSKWVESQGSEVISYALSSTGAGGRLYQNDDS